MTKEEARLLISKIRLGELAEIDSEFSKGYTIRMEGSEWGTETVKSLGANKYISTVKWHDGLITKIEYNYPFPSVSVLENKDIILRHLEEIINS